MANEVYHAWQPVTNLKGTGSDLMHFVEIIRHNDFLKIVMEDLQDHQLEIIYDDPDHKCPLEYVVWSFRWNTEIGLQSKPAINRDDRTIIDQNAQHFYKVEHSSYIHEFDKNWDVNSTLFPDVEHHVYMTGDEIFEVISNYEPRFVTKKK